MAFPWLRFSLQVRSHAFDRGRRRDRKLVGRLAIRSPGPEYAKYGNLWQELPRRLAALPKNLVLQMRE